MLKDVIAFVEPYLVFSVCLTLEAMALSQLSASKVGESTSTITLTGSAQMISEFFYFGLNSILYQRGIYPPENFKRSQKYGLVMLTTIDEKLEAYFKCLLSQLEEWLVQRLVQKLILVVAEVSTKQVVERWEFDIHNEAVSGELCAISFLSFLQLLSLLQILNHKLSFK